MISMLRFLMTSVGLTLIAISVGGFLLLPRMERYAVPLLEQQVSDFLGLPFRCEKIQVRPLLPGIEITQMSVLSDGEDKKALATCERIAVRVDPSTIFSPQPVISEMVLDGLVLFLRPGSGKEGGLGALVSGMGKRESRGALVVRKIACIHGKVSVADALLPGDGLTVPLDPFELNAGEGGNGISVGLAALRRMLMPFGEKKKVFPGMDSLISDLFAGLEKAGAG